MTELPTTFGKYYLTEKLATGGMAEIYLAKLVGPGGFEKQLVLKQIHPRLSGQRHFVDLFVAEAKMLVTLAHGNIVPVYELGVVDDTYFIAMEYIDGPTLYRLTEALARREVAMAPALAAWITARIVDGLDYAHRKGEGLIHRDLSPRNVMLSRDGEVKLVDFGIAVTLGDPGETAGTAAAPPTGSFPYMSPEQVRREPLTGQTDLFTVGVLLWEMLVGRRLFARGDVDATLAAVLEAEIPPPSATRPEVPAKLDDVVMRALARDRDARWPTAGDMLGALNRYLYSLDDTPGPRDVAALVGKFCPPETRRLPTEAEGLDLVGDDPALGGDATMPRLPDADEAPSGPIASGPRTAVIPRNRTPTGAHGKKPSHQQSFATHVQLKDMLERATPLFGFDAIQDQPVDPVSGAVAGAEPRAATAADASPAFVTHVTPARGTELHDDREPPPRATTARPRTAGRDAGRIDTVADAEARASETTSSRASGAPSRQLLVLAGVGGLVLAVAAAVVFMTGRGAVDTREAAVADAHRFEVIDAAGALVPAIDAASEDDAATTMSTIRDAGADSNARADAGHGPRDGGGRGHVDAAATAPSLDAAPSHPRDAGDRPPPIDAAAVATGTATLNIGAAPWAKIFIDGTRKGDTPLEQLTVTAGHHTVELVYDPPDETPRRHTFEIDPAAGATIPLQFDFTHAP